MTDKIFLKSLLQEQRVELSKPDFTDKLLHKIKTRQKRLQIVKQLVLGYCVCGVMVGLYFFLQPSVTQIFLKITQWWDNFSLNILLSTPCLISYGMVVFLALFFYCDSQYKHTFTL